MILGLHHVGRAVVDLDAVAADLAAMTTWPIERFERGEDALVVGRDVDATVRASGPNGWIELVGVDGPPSRRREVNEPGVSHAAIQSAPIDDVVARLDARGIRRHPGPLALGTGYLYLYVRDAEQLVTEVEGLPLEEPDLEPWLAHGAIATADLDRLRAAYEGLLRTTATNTVRLCDHPGFDRGTELVDVDVTATWVPTINATVEMWQYHHPATAPNPGGSFEVAGSGHLAFETDDLGADLRVALDSGFSLVDEPIADDGVTIARLLDPDGNWVELIEFDDGDDRRSLRHRPDPGRVGRMNARMTEVWS